MKKVFLSFLLASTYSLSTYADVIFRSKDNLKVSINPAESQVVHTALAIFQKDYKQVFAGELLKVTDAELFIGTLSMNPSIEKLVSNKAITDLRSHHEGFLIEVVGNKLLVLGSDKRGTAYGILELSRLIGVSPWEWWADAVTPKKDTFTLKSGFTRLEYPSVKNRGIFINDEDWGLMPWASKNFEPGLPTVGKTKGAMGPQTYAKVFELLLRLRANTIWPAMHEVTVPFYFSKGNREMADQYGIIVGTSHCEPLMRNSATEWDIAGTGDYNYITNKEGILNYWTERLKELKGSDNIYTIGLRGKHDGMMQGVKTLKEHKKVLQQVIYDERKLLATYTNPDVTKIPQLFIPYKEVLDVYNDGLDVPEDITLIWCDDNYGYIKHFPTPEEAARQGGNGIYYHISYWGRPHDYLWLATNHPAQIYTQMKTAYDKGAKDFWILNVGDIKPGEYLLELFLDMAWNMNAIENNVKGLDKHLQSWLTREFGVANAAALLPIMNEYYRLAYIRKPEFMGATRTEEQDPKFKIVADLPWSETEVRERIKAYEQLAQKVQALSAKVPGAKKDAWFQLIEYPVRGAAELNRKLLYGQLARHGKADWAISDKAHQNVIALTKSYNEIGNGKWKSMMDHRPRALAVFDQLPHTSITTPMLPVKTPKIVFNGIGYKGFNGVQPIAYGLGYERGAISLAKGSSVQYQFVPGKLDSIKIELALAPNHPITGKSIRYSIQVGDGPIQEVSYATEGRSEEWKNNVLTNQAKRTTIHTLSKQTTQLITVKALDEGVIIDQVKVW